MPQPQATTGQQPKRTDVDEASARVEQLLAELTAAGDPSVTRRAEELVRALVGLYGAGLARIVELAGDDGELLERFTADPTVAGLLVLHDLHPVGTEERVKGALARVRPFLGQHAGDVELLEVADGVVRLRLAGSCHGCPSSQVTVRHSIEQAIAAAAPEIAEVTVEGVVEEPAGPPLLQIGNLRTHPYADAQCPAEPVEAVQ